MRNAFLLLIVFILLQLTSCETTEPQKPKEEKPPGYQEDIPWPSLADSPWPMNHHDPQSTGRSQYVGPINGVLVGKIPASEMQSSLAIGYDSLIYYSTSSPGMIHCVDYNGIAKWDSLIGVTINTTPLIGKDNTIYVCTDYKQLLAFDSFGNLKWNFQSNLNVASLGMTINREGILFFIDASGTLFAVDSEGDLKWKYQDDKFYWGAPCAPTFSPDGNTLYIQGWRGVSVLAFDIVTQSVKWTFGDKILDSSPVVDSKGNIYIVPDNYDPTILYSLDQHGNLRWSFSFPTGGGLTPNTEPTIDKNGNIYFGVDTLYSLNYKGELRWKYGLEDFGIHSPLICDAVGNVYLGLAGFGGNKILAVSSEGKKLWDIKIEDERETGASPAIAEDGTLYYPTFRSKSILAIK